jgi:hypothetical protein
MALRHNPREDSMKTTAAVIGLFAAAAMVVPHLAVADGMQDPVKARELCEKRGEGDSIQALQRCCGNLILVADRGQQKKLEEQCWKGTGAKKEEEKKKK